MPGALLLGAYDWAAFGAPWHLSYKYVNNTLAGEQATGFFGLGTPSRYGLFEVFAGSGGLLVISPVLVMAAFGLFRLGRTNRAEAILAAAVTCIFVLSDAGYFDPYGGGSPGPRFLVVALPFLALGLGPAFVWRPRLTLILALFSIIPAVALTLAWSNGVQQLEGGVWGALSRIPVKLGSAPFIADLPPNVISAIGPSRGWGALLVCAAALGSFVLAFRAMPWVKIRAQRRDTPKRRPALRAVLIAGTCGYLVLASDVLALADYPYGNGRHLRLVVLRTSIGAPSPSSYLGGDVNFTISVTDHGSVGAAAPVLRINLPSGMRLVGPPNVTLGIGCTGTATLMCNFGWLRPEGKDTATIYFGVQITRPRNQVLTASASAVGDPRSNLASYTVTVGR